MVGGKAQVVKKNKQHLGPLPMMNLDAGCPIRASNRGEALGPCLRLTFATTVVQMVNVVDV
jgi:hypothetical protein